MNSNILITNSNSNVEIMVMAQTVSHVQGKNYVLLNTTDTRNCPEFYDNPVQSNSTSKSSINGTISIPHIKSELGNITEPVGDNIKTITNICPFLKIIYPYDCSSEVNKSSEIMCNSKEVFNQNDVEKGEEEEENNRWAV